MRFAEVGLRLQIGQQPVEIVDRLGVLCPVMSDQLAGERVAIEDAVTPHRSSQLVIRVSSAAGLRHVGEYHSQIANHPAGIVTATALLQDSQSPQQPTRESKLVSHLGEQSAARTRDQPGVRRDFYSYRASITHYLQGEPPGTNLRPSASRRIAAQRTFRVPTHPGARPSTAPPGPPGGGAVYHTRGASLAHVIDREERITALTWPQLVAYRHESYTPVSWEVC